MNNLLFRLRPSIVKNLTSSASSSSPITNTTSSSFSIINRKAHTVRVILTQDLPNNNQYAGETHYVKAGYARNYLIPKKLALYATHENFIRVGIIDPIIKEKQHALSSEIVEEKEDEDVKAADFLRYYLRNKTLKIWRRADNVNVTGVMSVEDMENAPIYPGKVDQHNIREKLSKQLNIDLDDFEKIQIYPEPVSFSVLDENEDMMEDILKTMDPLDSKDSALVEGGECKVELKKLGEYVVKIHLKGDQTVGLRLAVLRR